LALSLGESSYSLGPKTELDFSEVKVRRRL
jgi:hypothetical protein